jgi:hypothetical protein
MNNVSFNDEDFCVIFLVFSSMSLLVGICWAAIVDLQRRRATRRLRMELKNQFPSGDSRDRADQVR